jgi:hypothetical protein
VERSGLEPPTSSLQSWQPELQVLAKEGTYGSGSADPRQKPGSCAPAGPDLARLAEAMARLPEAERAAVLAHVEALAAMSPARRAALLTLAAGEGEQ